jgi:DHA3 family macrolide efflux protein-like MFS transporter
VFGVLSMIFSVSFPLGMIVFGPLADVIPINWIFIGSGIILLMLSVFLYSSRTLREKEKGGMRR